MLTDAQKQTQEQHICIKTSRGSLPPAAEKEREEEMGKRRES